MKYSLRSLMIAAIVAPPLLAWAGLPLYRRLATPTRQNIQIHKPITTAPISAGVTFAFKILPLLPPAPSIDGLDDFGPSIALSIGTPVVEKNDNWEMKQMLLVPPKLRLEPRP